MKRLKVNRLLAVAIVLAAGGEIRAQNFVPEYQFAGASLANFEESGSATWRAERAEIVGRAANASGGWLRLNQKYQDVAVAVSVQASADARGGLLLRSEATKEGSRGVLVSLAPDDLRVYEVHFSRDGQETSRVALPASRRPMIRSASMADHMTEERVPGFTALAELPELPTEAANGARASRDRQGSRVELKSGEWNTVQVILDSDLIYIALNGRRSGMPSVTLDQMMGFGAVALYAGGSGEIRYKDLALKDLNPKVEPKEQVSKSFRMQRLNDFYYGWCAAVADINQDGVNDVISGPFYFLGPDYTERHEFTAARTYNPSTQFSQAMVNFSYDFTGDGWPDILVVDQRPIWLFVNPKGESRRWARYNVIPKASTEIELFKDIDGDGVPEVLLGGEGVIAYAKPNPADPTAPWTIHPVSEKGRVNPHGMGVGDINGDGRMDILASTGWWEQPAPGAAAQPWPFHESSFGSGGAEMGVYDVNGDGLNDVVTALSAHGWGLAWFEQKRDAAGKITFAQHMIMGDYSTKNAGDVTFSELHATNFADIDGDGILDLIVGKRHFSHLDSYLDPDPFGPSVLYWYRTTRNPRAEGGAEFVPELIHNRSGVGSHFESMDINKDGSIDIVTSTNRGTFVFWGSTSNARLSTKSN